MNIALHPRPQTASLVAATETPPPAAHQFWIAARLTSRCGMFASAWSIYNRSFSDFERRSPLEQLRIMRHPGYRFSALLKGGEVVGLMAVWDLDEFHFLEHLAVAPEQRSAGLGGLALRTLQKMARKPIVLDVEPFHASLSAARRVAFYRRLGFHYDGAPVTLPPYAGKATGLSHLMSWPMALGREGRARVVAIIEREIYGMGPFQPRHRAV